MLICSLAGNMQLSGTVPDLLSSVTTLRYVDLGECSVFSPKVCLAAVRCVFRIEYALWILISSVRFMDTASVVCSQIEPFLGPLCIRVRQPQHLTGVWLQNWDLNLFSSCTNIRYILMQATQQTTTCPDGVGSELQHWWHYPVDISKGYHAGLVVIGKLHLLLACRSQLVGSLTMLFREL